MFPLDLITRFFSRESSKDVAKERLRLVLVQDRTDLSPSLLEALREDLVRVISHYMEIEEAAMEVEVVQKERSVALTASIPVRRVKPEACPPRKG